MAEHLEALDEENIEAWRVFHQVACRLTMDFPGIVGPVLAKVVEDKDGQDAADLLERMGVIYDVLHPPKTTTS